MGLIVSGIEKSLTINYILRTTWEDRVLLEELEGYNDYAREVPCRLLPMIW